MFVLDLTIGFHDPDIIGDFSPTPNIDFFANSLHLHLPTPHPPPEKHAICIAVSNCKQYVL